MDTEHENFLINYFEDFDSSNFNVSKKESNYIFLCGGQVDGASFVRASFRDYLYEYTENKIDTITSVLAESFNDYGLIYNDLLAFESDIASVSSLVIVFLESPGSLVELGMFCMTPYIYEKLIVVVPDKHVQSENSFIYLGPITHLRKNREESVLIYPFPETGSEYDSEHVDDLVHTIKKNLEKIPCKVKFNESLFEHRFFLVYQIIKICNPVLIGEIELILLAMDVELEREFSELKQILYLMRKMGMIEILKYSSYSFYYPLVNCAYVTFGRTKSKRSVNLVEFNYEMTDKLRINKNKGCEQAKKRLAAKKIIMERGMK